MGEAFSYILPAYIDPEEDPVTVTVDLKAASLFMSFSDGTLTIEAGATTAALIDSYSISVSLSDTSENEVKSDFTLTVAPPVDDVSEDVEEEEVAEVAEFYAALLTLSSLSSTDGWDWGE